MIISITGISEVFLLELLCFLISVGHGELFCFLFFVGHGKWESITHVFWQGFAVCERSWLFDICLFISYAYVTF